MYKTVTSERFVKWSFKREKQLRQCNGTLHTLSAHCGQCWYWYHCPNTSTNITVPIHRCKPQNGVCRRVKSSLRHAKPPDIFCLLFMMYSTVWRFFRNVLFYLMCTFCCFISPVSEGLWVQYVNVLMCTRVYQLVDQQSSLSENCWCSIMH